MHDFDSHPTLTCFLFFFKLLVQSSDSNLCYEEITDAAFEKRSVVILLLSSSTSSSSDVTSVADFSMLCC
ncbi:hypothetical protein OWV82_020310 [Melia azedarach]|uniref:Uncharacterized protein n=1 Tax=Melia azedarach TaxID=155640 RepID=A0ACC1X5I1_MELAZ|nr:hypothetical protein OWV82_020310 [Melia azedarach]